MFKSMVTAGLFISMLLGFGARAEINISKLTVSGNFLYIDVISNLKFPNHKGLPLVVTLSNDITPHSAIPLSGAARAKNNVIPSRCEDCQGQVATADRSVKFVSAAYEQRKKTRLVFSFLDLCTAGGRQTDSLCSQYFNQGGRPVFPRLAEKKVYVSIGVARDSQSVGPIFGVSGSDTQAFTISLRSR